MAEQLRVVVANPGEDARAAEIPDTYQGVIDAIGGMPTKIRLSEDLVAFVNEDSLLLGLPWNRQLGPHTYLAGPILVVGGECSAWRSRSLTPLEEADVLRLLNQIAPRLDHTRASGIEDLVAWTGERVIWCDLFGRWGALGQVA